MNNLPRLLLLLLATTLLGACGIFGDKDDEDLEPKELVDFQQTLKLKKVWSAKLGGDAESQGQLGADHGEVDVELGGEVGELVDMVRGNRDRIRDLGDAGVGRSAVELLEQWALAQLPADGVLSAAGSDDQDFHEDLPEQRLVLRLRRGSPRRWGGRCRERARPLT